MLGIKFGSVYFTENSGYRSSKIVVCGTRNIPYRFPYCDSRTTGSKNGYATTIFQTSVTGIFSEIDTSIKFISVGTSLGSAVSINGLNCDVITKPVNLSVANRKHYLYWGSCLEKAVRV